MKLLGTYTVSAFLLASLVYGDRDGLSDSDENEVDLVQAELSAIASDKHYDIEIVDSGDNFGLPDLGFRNILTDRATINIWA